MVSYHFIHFLHVAGSVTEFLVEPRIFEIDFLHRSLLVHSRVVGVADFVRAREGWVVESAHGRRLLGHPVAGLAR